MKFRSMMMLAFAASLVLAVSCQTSVNRIENSEKEMQRKEVAFDKVISDRSMDKRLQVLRIDEVMLSTGLLQVQTRVRNTSRKPFRFS